MMVSSLNQWQCRKCEGLLADRLGVAHAFFTQFVDALTSILHGFLCLGRLRLALGYTGIPFGLFSVFAGFVVFLFLHGKFRLLELVLRRFHLDRGVLGGTCGHGSVDRRLSHCVLLAWRFSRTTGKKHAGAHNQRGQFQPAEAVGLGVGSADVHGGQLHFETPENMMVHFSFCLGRERAACKKHAPRLTPLVGFFCNG
jgi:hypothetical protein